MEQCEGARTAGTDPATSSDGWTYDFPTLTAAGGQYELCWCVGIEPYLCVFDSHFGIKVGKIVLHGPTGGQSYGCVKNSPCELATVKGEGIADGDKVSLASGACGSANEIFGIEEAARYAQISVKENGDNGVSYATALMQITPGTYDLCWCRGECAIGDFRVPIGTLRMEGPRPGQSLDCVRGQACGLRVVGELLQVGEYLMPLLACGEGSAACLQDQEHRSAKKPERRRIQDPDHALETPSDFLEYKRMGIRAS